MRGDAVGVLNGHLASGCYTIATHLLQKNPNDTERFVMGSQFAEAGASRGKEA